VGIHAFWESRIPELYGDEYDFMVGRAEFILHIQLHAWTIVEASFSALDSVLAFEKTVSKTFPSDKKYSFEQAGSKTLKVYSEEYAKAYNDLLDGMVERRMRSAIMNVGSFWYSAWVNAGSPEINSLGVKDLSEAMKKNLEDEDKQSQSGELKGRGHETKEK
jgi:hypothetical protein